MKVSLKAFYKSSIHDFFEAVGNIFIFLPYFFSTATLLKTLFAPWKNITTKKTERGFSFSDVLNRFGYNTISRMMGFIMRFCILCFFVITQVTYFLSLIVIVPLFILCVPILYLISQYEVTEEERKESLKERFIASHLLNESNRVEVEKWFEQLYKTKLHHTKWWKLNNLFSMPPIGRDWAAGYTPILDEFAEDLTSTAYQLHIKDIIGRKNEIALIEQTLSKTEEANIILVGEEGVGKHAVIDAFTKHVYEGKTNTLLAYKRVLKLNMEKILTQYLDSKQRESFFEDLMREAVEAKNIILLVENIDKYISSGEGRVDLSLIYNKYGKTAQIQIIGLTSPFFYQKYIVSNDKISHIFTKLDVYEVAKQEAILILLNTVPLLEQRYGITIPYESIINAIEKSDFFITQLPFPEKAVQLMDTASVYITQTLNKNQLLPEDINVVLTQSTHVPITLTSQLKEKLLNIEVSLKKQVINQDPALTEVASALRRAFILLGKRKKPLASFLFLGPTGVGKTETAKALARIFFNSDKNINRFDMSLYQSKTDIEKLVGSIDTNNPGLLTESIRNNPYGILLLDELEKAHKDLLNIFLTIFDEGYFTNGFGKRVDCKNLIIIATSNAGASEIYKNQKNPNEHFDLMNYLIENNLYSPEFLNRFDGVITFNAITQDAAYTIAQNMLKTVVADILNLYKVKVEISDATLHSIIELNYDSQYGARNLERALRQNIEDKVAKIILEDKAKEGDIIKL